MTTREYVDRCLMKPPSSHSLMMGSIHSSPASGQSQMPDMEKMLERDMLKG